MVVAIDEVLDVLRDGKWHTIEDIQTKCRHLNQNQIQFIIAFLREYGFVDSKRQRWSTKLRVARLTLPMLNFLQRLEDLKG